MTGVVDVQSAVDAMKVGATDYLLKPFDRATLASALEGDPPARAAAPGARPPARREHRVPRRARAVRARARAVPRHLARGALRARARRPVPRDRRAGRRALVAARERRPAELRLARGARARAARGGARAAHRERAARRRCATSGAATALVDWSEPDGLPRPALVVALRRGRRARGSVPAHRQARRRALRRRRPRLRREVPLVRGGRLPQRRALPAARAAHAPGPATPAPIGSSTCTTWCATRSRRRTASAAASRC